MTGVTPNNTSMVTSVSFQQPSSPQFVATSEEPNIDPFLECPLRQSLKRRDPFEEIYKNKNRKVLSNDNELLLAEACHVSMKIIMTL